MRFTYKLVMLLVLVVVGVGVLLVVLTHYKFSITKKNNLTEKKVVEVTWQRYETTDLGFVFYYPQDWQLNTVKEAPNKLVVAPRDIASSITTSDDLNTGKRHIVISYYYDRYEYDPCLITSRTDNVGNCRDAANFQGNKSEIRSVGEDGWEYVSGPHYKTDLIEEPDHRLYTIEYYDDSAQHFIDGVDKKLLESFIALNSAAKPQIKDNYFNLYDIKAGDKVGSMVIDKVDVAKQSPVTWSQPNINNYKVDFSGEVEVSGNYYSDPEDPFANGVCFDADAESTAKLPYAAIRTNIDVSPTSTHRFCFSNQDLALAQLGPIGASGKARLKINRLSLISYPSEGSDLARLVSVISKE